MTDDLELTEGLSSPYDDAVALTPADSVDLSHETRGLYVGGAGDASIGLASSGTATFVGMLAGTIYPLRVKQLNSTNTTATNMIGLR